LVVPATPVPLLVSQVPAQASVTIL